MSILEVKGLTHRFDNKPLFNDASFRVNNGEHIGIVGLNGAGKSTFINIISGKLPQDAGEVNWLPGIRWSYLDQHADIDRSLSVMQYLRSAFGYLYDIEKELLSLYEQMSETTDEAVLDKLIGKSARMQDKLIIEGFYDLDAEIKKVAGGLGLANVGYDNKIGRLSGGERAKLMLAKILLEKPDIMLLDEPTNFLDIEHIEWLKGFLNSFPGTYMVISHDNAFLNATCSFIINIENGQIRKFSGNYRSFMAQREQIAKQYEESYQRQQREIAKMEDYIARNKVRAATAGMANSRKKQLERMQVLEKPVIIHEAHFHFPCEPVHTLDMLVVKDLVIGYTKPILPPISLHIKGDDKLWIRGTNGIGKSTLLKTLTQRIPRISGSFKFHIQHRKNYLEQDIEFYSTEINAVIYVNETFPRLNAKQQRAMLAEAGIKGELATKPIKNLSGGEQVRIKLAFLGQRESNILLLDEPTNHLDIKAKEALKNALVEYPGAIVLVSHEKEFAEAVCNKVFDIK
jgi:ATPase subunit of ABC transporter with duplicated ATPase domains